MNLQKNRFADRSGPRTTGASAAVVTINRTTITVTRITVNTTTVSRMRSFRGTLFRGPPFSSATLSRDTLEKLLCRELPIGPDLRREGPGPLEQRHALLDVATPVQRLAA